MSSGVTNFLSSLSSWNIMFKKLMFSCLILNSGLFFSELDILNWLFPVVFFILSSFNLFFTLSKDSFKAAEPFLSIIAD